MLAIMPGQATVRPLPRISLVAAYRKSESGSGAFLGLGDDGREYWVKAPNNPQGNYTLAAEVVVHGLGRLLGAPMPETALLQIPDSMRFEYAPARRLKGGVGHGSQNIQPAIVADEWETYIALDGNRERQAVIFGLWDLCMGGDPQWIHNPAEDYSIWTFDHGFWLGGESSDDWSADSLRSIGTTPWQYDLDPGGLSASALVRTADKIASLTADQVQSIISDVPLEWAIRHEDLDALCDLLIKRAAGVSGRLIRAASESRHE